MQVDFYHLTAMPLERALPQIAALTRHRRWTAWGKTTQMRTAALDTLANAAAPARRAIR